MADSDRSGPACAWADRGDGSGEDADVQMQWLPGQVAEEYLREVIPLLRVVRVLLTLVLAVFVISFIVGVARPETGILEKVVFVTLIAGCVFLAAQVSTWSTKVQARIRRT